MPHGFDLSRRLARVPRWLVALLAIDALVRAFFLAMGTPPLEKDPVDYWVMGLALTRGDWLIESHPIAFRTPGYPAFMAPFQLAFDGWAALAVAASQQILGWITHTLAIAMVLGLTRSRAAATVTWALLVASLSTLYAANVLLTETLYTFLVVALAAASFRYVRAPSAALAVVLGGIVGAATLVRPVAQLQFVPLAAVILAWPWLGTGAPSARRRLLQAGALVLTVLALVAPWALRNQALFGEPVLTKFVGRSTWRAAFLSYGRNLPYPTSMQAGQILELTDLERADPELRHNWGVYNRLRQRGLDEFEAEDLMFTVARQAVLGNVGRYLAGLPRDFAVFFAATSFPIRPAQEHTVGDRLGQHDYGWPALRAWYQAHGPPAPTESRLVNGILSLLALVGLGAAFLRREWRLPVAFLIAIVGYHTVLSVVAEYPNYRYRSVIEPLLAMGIGLLPWWTHSRHPGDST